MRVPRKTNRDGTGPGGKSCKLHIHTIRSECSASMSAYRRVESFDLAGKVTGNGLLLAGAGLHKGNAAVRSTLYDIAT